MTDHIMVEIIIINYIINIFYNKIKLISWVNYIIFQREYE